MSRILIIAALIVILYFGIRYLLYQLEKNRIIEKVSSFLADLDDKYERFIKKRLTLSVLSGELEQEVKDQLVEESFKQLQPELSVFIAYIKQSAISIADLPSQSHYFPALAKMVETIFQRSSFQKDRLSPEDQAIFEKILKEELESNIEQRIVALKTSHFIE